MALFFHSHLCNKICKSMGLTPFDLAPAEKTQLDFTNKLLVRPAPTGVEPPGQSLQGRASRAPRASRASRAELPGQSLQGRASRAEPPGQSLKGLQSQGLQGNTNTTAQDSLCIRILVTLC